MIYLPMTDSPETLGGTCAVNTYIDGNWDDENEIKEKLQKTIEMVKRTYGTRKIVVIGGDYATNGMDDNEIIIEDAVVVAMI